MGRSRTSSKKETLLFSCREINKVRERDYILDHLSDFVHLPKNINFAYFQLFPSLGFHVCFEDLSVQVVYKGLASKLSQKTQNGFLNKNKKNCVNRITCPNPFVTKQTK